MIATALVHIAIWTQFAAAHAASMYLALHAAKPASAPVEEKVVIRDATLSEKCGLDIEAVCHPDQDISDLQAEAKRIEADLGYCQHPPKTSCETPNLHRSGTDWNKQFALHWDDDGEGFSFGGTHFPDRHFPPPPMTFNFCP